MKINRKITSQDSADNLSRYFSDIRNFQPLTKEEELVLIKSIQKNNDQQALNKLIHANVRFVVSVAKNYQGQGMQILDLVSEGNVGLIKAAKDFNPKWDIKFFSYAVWHIRKQMFTNINNYKRNIRLPDNRWLLVDRIKKETNKLEQLLERHPTVDELCDFLEDINKWDIHEAIVHAGVMPSIQDKLSGDEVDEGTLEDTIEAKDFRADSEELEISFLSDLNKFLFWLTQYEYDIIVLALGLNEESSLITDVIAERLKMKPKDVIKLKANALKKLKKIPQINLLREYL